MPDYYFGVPGYWRLKRCDNRDCGLIWQDPMVIDEDLGVAYQNYYTHGADSSDMVRLRRSVVNGRFYYGFDRWLTWLLRLRNERLRFASSYLDNNTSGTVLDVGCGGGFFTDKLQRLGWTVRGSDVDPLAARAATEKYGFPVDVGELSAIGYADESFDAITVRHVIEHLATPKDFLLECWRILKPGGRLVFITPNADSLGHRYFGRRWRGLEQPRHLILLNVQSMKAVFRQAGIETVTIFATPQGANYVASDCCRISVSSLQWMTDYAAIWWLYALEGVLTKAGRHVGEELVACAVKGKPE